MYWSEAYYYFSLVHKFLGMQLKSLNSKTDKRQFQSF